MDFSSSILFVIVFLPTFLSIVYGSRNFHVIIEDCKCSGNSKYAYEPICYVNKTSKNPSAFISVKLNREIPKFQYGLDIYLVKNKNERYPILQVNRNEGCTFFEGKIRMVLVRAVREMLLQAGTLPKKCPIEKDFHFLYKELRVDADKLPPLFPEGVYDIKVNITTTQKKELIATVSSVIRVLPKPK